MKIAVTGATGFVGKWLLKDFSDKHEFIIIGRKELGTYVNIDNNKYSYVCTDYTIPSLANAFKGIDAVIHLAAQRPGINYKSEGFDVSIENIKMSISVIEACLINNIKNIVMASSISVYSSENPLPWKEDMNVQPLGHYGIGKVTVENLSNFYNSKDKLNIKNLRIGRIVGTGEREGFMLTNFINQANKKETLKLYGKGIGKREYIYVRDVANALVSAVEAENSRGIYNIGTGVNTTHKDLAEMINKVFDNEGNLQLLEDKPEDTMEFLMNCEKAKNELNWKASWTLEEALQDMKKIMQNNV